MDYHNKMLEEKDTKIKELEGEIEKLQRMLIKYKVCEEEKVKRIKYLENVLTYLENKLGFD